MGQLAHYCDILSVLPYELNATMCIEVKQQPPWTISLYDKFLWVGGKENGLHSRLVHLIVKSYIVGISI